MEKMQSPFAGISELASEYADLVYLHAISEFKSRQTRQGNFKITESGFLLESIDNGISGELLFLLAEYQLSGDTGRLEKIDAVLTLLSDYCSQNLTLDYSLYTGRGGVSYVLLQRYLVDKDEKFLRQAINLMEPCIGEYLYSDFTTDNLYNGRSGTILLLWALYKYSGEQVLVDFINRFIERLLQNAKFSEKGLFWVHEDELNINPLIGLADGVAGISYVLTIINEDVNSEVLQIFINQINQYIDAQWNEDFNNWNSYKLTINEHSHFESLLKRYASGDQSIYTPKNDQSWAHGSIGILVAGLKKANSSEIRHIQQDIVMRSTAFSNVNADLEFLNLKNGIAGKAMFLLHIGHAALPSYIDHLSNADNNDIDLAGGLMNGYLGAVYFLIKSITTHVTQENISFPFFNIAKQGSPVNEIPILKQVNIKNELIRILFPKTISLLEVCQQSVLMNFYQNDNRNTLINSFEKSFFAELQHSVAPDTFKRLSDVFKFELNKLPATLGKSSQLQFVLQRHLDRVSALELLSHDDDLLRKKTISLNNAVQLIETKWNWSFKSDYKPMNRDNILKLLHHNLMSPAGEFSYITESINNYEIDYLPLSLIYKIYFYFLTEPKVVSQLIQDIQAFVQIQPLERIKMWHVPEFSNKTINSIGDVLNHLDDIVLDISRSLIYRNILKVS